MTHSSSSSKEKVAPKLLSFLITVIFPISINQKSKNQNRSPCIFTNIVVFSDHCKKKNQRPERTKKKIIIFPYKVGSDAFKNQ